MSPKADVSNREQVFNEAVSDHGASLLSTIGARVRDEKEAEDIRQEVFQEFLEAYDVGTVIESLGAWLVQVAKHKIIDRFRRKQSETAYREQTLFSEPAANTTGDPEAEWTRSWLRAEIAEGLSLLPEEQRDVFVKHELEGKSFDEIARETGVAVNTLLSRKRYAILFLKEYLKEVYDELNR